MAADGEPQDDGGGSESSESSTSTSSPVPCPPRPAAAAQPAPSAPLAPASSSAPLPPHLYYQQRLLSLHLSPAAAATPPSQHRPLHAPNSEPPPASAPDRPFRDDCWSDNATLTLIQAWGDRYVELNRGNLKQKHWKDVADCVNARPLSSSKPPKTDVQCKNRLDTLKKKYKIEKSKLVTGGAPSKWAFFDRLDELIGSSKKNKAQSSGKVSRSASAAAITDGNCMINPDGQCMAMSIGRCLPEEDVKPPLFFLPPQATIALPPPPLNHHVGGVVVHMNHQLGNVLHLNHHVGAPIIHHLAGEGTHINHLAGMPNYHLAGCAAGTAAGNHQGCDGDGAAVAADTASKSKAGPDLSQSSLPHKRPAYKRRIKRKRDGPKSNDDGAFRELASAICKFGDVYEKVEIAKLEQATMLEKQRMELIKDLEIQRMQMFAQMQIERAKMKYGSTDPSNAENHS